MKKSYLFIAAAALSVGAIVSSCGKKTLPQVAGEKEIVIPCQDKTTDKDFFRGMGIGQSKDANTAREKARMAANAELATSMSVTIKSVTERYVNDAGITAADFSQSFEALTKQVVNQELNNVQQCCIKTVTTTDGMIKVYMAVEANKKDVLEKLEREAAASKKLETAFNREKFRQNYEAEMADFAKKNGY